MTAQQMEKMTESEIKTFDKKCCTFNENQSLDEYTTDIRDTIYIWRHIAEKRKAYTIDKVNELIQSKSVQIKSFYDEKEPVAYAAIDVDYCCG